MFHAGANQVRQFAPLRLERRFHYTGRLNLLVVLSAIGNHRQIEEIARIGRHVINAPEFSFIPGNRGWIGLGVLGGFRKASTGSNGTEPGTIVRSNVPSTSAAHGEADKNRSRR